MSAIQVNREDWYFGDCVKIRSNYTCENPSCGYQSSDNMGLDCAHVFSRGNNSTRLHSKNAICLCVNCHRVLLTEQEVRERIAVGVFGQEVVDEMRILSKKPLKKLKGEDLKQVIIDFRKFRYEMHQARKRGVLERIEFVGYPM